MFNLIHKLLKRSDFPLYKTCIDASSSASNIQRLTLRLDSSKKTQKKSPLEYANVNLALAIATHKDKIVECEKYLNQARDSFLLCGGQDVIRAKVSLLIIYLYQKNLPKADETADALFCHMQAIQSQDLSYITFFIDSYLEALMAQERYDDMLSVLEQYQQVCIEEQSKYLVRKLKLLLQLGRQKPAADTFHGIVKNVDIGSKDIFELYYRVNAASCSLSLQEINTALTSRNKKDPYLMMVRIDVCLQLSMYAQAQRLLLALNNARKVTQKLVPVFDFLMHNYSQYISLRTNPNYYVEVASFSSEPRALDSESLTELIMVPIQWRLEAVAHKKNVLKLRAEQHQYMLAELGKDLEIDAQAFIDKQSVLHPETGKDDAYMHLLIRYAEFLANLEVYPWGRGLNLPWLFLPYYKKTQKEDFSLLFDDITNPKDPLFLGSIILVRSMIVMHWVNMGNLSRAKHALNDTLAKLAVLPLETNSNRGNNYLLLLINRMIHLLVSKPWGIDLKNLQDINSAISINKQSFSPELTMRLALFRAHIKWHQGKKQSTRQCANNILKRLSATADESTDEELFFYALNLQAEVAIACKQPKQASQYCRMIQEAYGKQDKVTQAYNQTIYFKSCLYLYLNDRNGYREHRIHFQRFFAEPFKTFSQGQIGFSIYLLLSDGIVDSDSHALAFEQMQQCRIIQNFLPRLAVRLLRTPKLLPEIFCLVINLRVMSVESVRGYERTNDSGFAQQAMFLQKLSDTIVARIAQAIGNANPDDSTLSAIVNCLKKTPSQVGSINAQDILEWQKQILNENGYLGAMFEARASASPAPGGL